MSLALHIANPSDYKRIKPLFTSAFPPEERPPYFFLRRRGLQGKAEMLTVTDGDAFIGFAYLVCHRDLAYLFLFAIDDGCRGKGYGGKVLGMLRERYAGKRLFLARETLDEKAGNYEQRVRRRAFYMRNGFQDLPVKIKEASVVYDVMSSGGSVAPGEYDALITQWMGRSLRRLIDMRLMA